MKLTNDGVNPDPHADLGPVEIELSRNYFITSQLRSKVREGKGWEGALVGLVRQALEVVPELGEPRWRRIRARNSSTTFEFESFAEWVNDSNALGLADPLHLIQLLEISPDEGGRVLADRVRQELKLPPGTRTDLTPDLANNVREVAGSVHQQEAGNSAAGVRRRIRNWIQQNPEAENLALAKEWLAKLEANPRSRQHQQALREIGIGRSRRALDVTEVPELLIERLRDHAQAERLTLQEVLEDAFAVYLRMVEDLPAEEFIEGAGASTQSPANALPLPEPGFYGLTEAARLVGASKSALSQSASLKPSGGQLLARKLKDASFELLFHPENEQARRVEIRHKTSTQLP